MERTLVGDRGCHRIVYLRELVARIGVREVVNFPVTAVQLAASLQRFDIDRLVVVGHNLVASSLHVPRRHRYRRHGGFLSCWGTACAPLAAAFQLDSWMHEENCRRLEVFLITASQRTIIDVFVAIKQSLTGYRKNDNRFFQPPFYFDGYLRINKCISNKLNLNSPTF